MKADPTLPWYKSTFSQGSTGCVETAPLPHGRTVAIRDSKDPNGPILQYSTGSWRVFVRKTKLGHYDVDSV